MVGHFPFKVLMLVQFRQEVVLLVNLKQQYLELSFFIILSLFLLLLSYSLSKKQNNDIEKLSAYEWGFDPFGLVSHYCLRLVFMGQTLYFTGAYFIEMELRVEVLFFLIWAAVEVSLVAVDLAAVLFLFYKKNGEGADALSEEPVVFFWRAVKFWFKGWWEDVLVLDIFTRLVLIELAVSFNGGHFM
jgi:hypothetical protein